MIDRSFDWIYTFTEAWEGGFTDNHDDLGGRTKFGITQETADAHDLGPVELFTPLQARLFYYAHYWRPYASWYLSAVMFDTAVNFGIVGSDQFLQEALGFPLEDCDGIVGPRTRARMAMVHPDNLARQICRLRAKYRHQRVQEDPSQATFLEGWLNRDQALYLKVGGNGNIK